MQRHAVADLAGHTAVVGIYGADEYRWPWLVRLAGTEKWRHQREVVVFAVVGQPLPGLPGVPYSVQRLDVFSHPRARRRPFCGEAALDVPFHLASQTKTKAASGIVLQV